MTVRPMRESDLDAVQSIQRGSREGAHWPVADYLRYDAIVVEESGRVLGFAAAQRILPDEVEILNVAVDPSCRRRGAARILVTALLHLPFSTAFLEVRESNLAARNLYTAMGFRECGRRAGYYPPVAGSAGSAGTAAETAIVMLLQK